MAEDSDTGPLEGATAGTGPGAGLQTFNGLAGTLRICCGMWQAQQSVKALSLFAALVTPLVDGQPIFDPDNAATYIGCWRQLWTATPAAVGL